MVPVVQAAQLWALELARAGTVRFQVPVLPED
jgi:hypothetical protein